MASEDEDELRPISQSEAAEENEKKSLTPWSKIYVLYYITFLMTSAWTVTYTSMWPYITSIDPNVDTTFLGLVNCVRGFAAMFASILFGYWCDYRGANEPLILSNVLFLIGHVIYIFPRNIWVIMAARFLIGLSSGSISLCRTLAAKLCSKEELVQVMSIIGLVEAFAFFFGPISQLIAATTAKHKIMEKLQKYHINMYTIPVWVLILLGLISFLLQAKFIFCNDDMTDLVLEKGKKEKKATKRIKIDKCIVSLLLVVFFSLMTVPSAFETIIVPALMDFYALTKKEAIVMSCVIIICYTALNIAGYALIPVANKKVKDKVILLFGILAVTTGVSLTLPFGPGKLDIKPPVSLFGNKTITSELVGCPYQYSWCHTTPRLPLAQFLIALVIVAIGEPPSFTGASVLFIKAIGSENQGSYIGWYSGVESLSRIIGPIYGSFMYLYFGQRGVYGGILVFLLVNIMCYVISWKRLDPSEEQYVSYEELNQDIEDENQSVAEEVVVSN